MLAGGLLALTFLLGCFRLWDTDVWWHLRTGQLIWAQGHVPRGDWFTYTNPDATWIDLHWGFELILAGLYALGGIPLLVLFKAVVGAAAVALCLAARRAGWPLELAVALWLPALFVLTGRLYERPELFTILFLSATLLVLFHAGRRPRVLWALPAIQLLWVNSQGLFVLGLLPLAFFWIDLLLRAGAGERAAAWWAAPGGVGADSPPARQALWPSVAAVAACFVNPYFARGALFPVELFQKISGRDDFYRRIVGELQGVGDFLLRYGFRNPYAALFIVTLALAALSFVALLLFSRLSPFRLLLFAAFAYLGWQAKRNSSVFAIMMGAVTVWNASDAWALLKEARRSRATTPQRSVARLGRPVLAATLALLAVLVVTNRFYDWAGEGRRFGLGERAGWFAHEGCEFLGRAGMPDRALVADLGQAAVYIFHNGPQHKVFADPRLEVNSRGVIERYLEIVRRMGAGDRIWEELLDAPRGADRGQDFPAVLLDTMYSREMIAGLLRNPRWRCVHVDELAVVFLTVERADALGLATIPLRPETIPWPPE